MSGMRRHVAILLVAGAASALACASTPSDEELLARTPDAPSRAKSARGGRAIDLDWDPNGLAWDSRERALYAIDQGGNRLMRWTDRRGFQVAASLPRARGAASGPVGVARLADGRTVIARSGKGGSSVIVISEVRGAESLSSLAPDRRRVGVAVGAGEQVYITSSGPAGKDGPQGHVSRVDLAEPSETDLPFFELLKPVGVVLVDGVLYVSDQTRGEIVALTLVPLGSAHAVAQLKSPDVLAAGPAGSVLASSKTGAVWQLFSDGRLIRLLTSRQEVRGITYDPAGKRMFFAEHDPEGVEHRLQIVPLQ
jgi:sugar lactone lactonase YvrE